MTCDVGEATEWVRGGGSAHSATLPSLHLRHMQFTYVTWRAAHEPNPPLEPNSRYDYVIIITFTHIVWLL